MNTEQLIDVLKDIRDLIEEALDEFAIESTDMFKGEVPDSDMEVGDKVQFANIRSDDGSIEILHGKIVDILQRDGESFFNRVVTEEGRKFKVPVVIGDTRRGTKVICKIG